MTLLAFSWWILHEFIWKVLLSFIFVRLSSWYHGWNLNLSLKYQLIRLGLKQASQVNCSLARYSCLPGTQGENFVALWLCPITIRYAYWADFRLFCGRILILYSLGQSLGSHSWVKCPGGSFWVHFIRFCSHSEKSYAHLLLLLSEWFSYGQALICLAFDGPLLLKEFCLT